MAEPAASVKVGDPIPWFSVFADAQKRDVVAVDEWAGRPLVLFFFPSAADAAVGAALNALFSRSDLFDGKRAACLAVSNDPDDLARARPRDDGQGRLVAYDPNAGAARQFGLADPTAGAGRFPPTAFLLSRELQALDIVALADPTEFARRLCAGTEERLSWPRGPDSAPLLVAPRIFDRELCARLIQLYDDEGGRELGAIEKSGAVVAAYEPGFRKRRDHYIQDPALLGVCRENLSRRLLPMIYRAFQFQTTRIERYLIGCYGGASGGYFRPHRDNTQPVVAHRRFALSIVLNDDFEGGELTFPEFGETTYRADPGDAFVFSCSLLHEVRPVTAGLRYAFISFFYDEAGQRQREQHMRATGGGP